MVSLENILKTVSSLKKYDPLELVPVYGAFQAKSNFESRKDTIPCRYDQTFPEAYNRQFLFFCYHWAWFMLGAGYILNEIIK